MKFMWRQQPKNYAVILYAHDVRQTTETIRHKISKMNEMNEWMNVEEQKGKPEMKKCREEEEN